MASTFSKRKDDATRPNEAEIDKLHSKIGQLVVERDFFELNRISKASRDGLSGEGLGSLSKDRRQMCIERSHPKNSLRRQCKLLSLARSNLYYQPTGEGAENLRFIAIIRCPAGACTACCREGTSSSWKRHGTSHVSLSGHCCACACRAVDGATHATAGAQMWLPSCAPFNAPYAFGSNLPDAKHPLPGNTCLHV